MSSLFSVSSRRTSLRKQAGFGLVELMVSISVMAIVAAIILTRQDAFNSAVLLRGQAYEIALSIREVQLSAVSASGDAGNFRTVYGLYFDASAGGSYQVFRDANGDGFYNSGSEAFGQVSKLDPRFEIRDVREVTSSGESSIGDVSVVFERPNFDARFYDSSGLLGNTVSGIEIDVAREGNNGTTCGTDFRTVEVTKTGQIAVIDC